MTTIKVKVLEAMAIILTNGSIMRAARSLVAIVNDNDVSNEAKHEKVLYELRKLGGDFGTTLLDIIIKLMLLALRAKIADAKV